MNSKTRINAWYSNPQEAIELQKKLAPLIIQEDCLGHVRFIAGVDMAINEVTNKARGAAVVMSYPELHIVEEHVHEEALHMPYIPGLLSFREAPSIVGAFSKLTVRPDLIMVDGTGRAHPRYLGIASHLGLLWDMPTIGCAKSCLVGTYDESRLGSQAGSWVPLIYKKEIVGAVVRTRTNIKPLFISVGHRISLETAIKYVLACSRYRLPEPVRQADKLSKLLE